MPETPQSLKESPSPSSDWPSTSRPSKSREKSAPRPSRARPTPARKESASSLRKHSKGKRLSRRDAILHRLGLTSEQVDSQPQIASMLRQCGLNPTRFIEVLSVDQDESSIKAVALWNSLSPHSRSAAGLEGLALAIGITPRRLWELYAGAALTQSREMVGIMIAESLPEIMKVTIKQAKTPKGFTSREHILKAARVLPVPKGSTTNINVGAQPAELESGSEDESGRTLESSDDALMKFSRAMGVKQLAAPVVDAEVDDEEDD